MTLQQYRTLYRGLYTAQLELRVQAKCAEFDWQRRRAVECLEAVDGALDTLDELPLDLTSEEVRDAQAA